MSRKPIIAGNWKMNLLQDEAKALFEGIKNFTKDFTAPQLPTIVIAPVFTSLNIPFETVHRVITCCGIERCSPRGCFNSWVRHWPYLRRRFVSSSRSELNWVNDSSSLAWAKSIRMLPEAFFIDDTLPDAQPFRLHRRISIDTGT